MNILKILKKEDKRWFCRCKMGPEYYQKIGYKIEIDKIKKYLEFPKVGQFETLQLIQEILKELLKKDQVMQVKK